MFTGLTPKFHATASYLMCGLQILSVVKLSQFWWYHPNLVVRIVSPQFWETLTCFKHICLPLVLQPRGARHGTDGGSQVQYLGKGPGGFPLSQTRPDSLKMVGQAYPRTEIGTTSGKNNEKLWELRISNPVFLDELKEKVHSRWRTIYQKWIDYTQIFFGSYACYKGEREILQIYTSFFCHKIYCSPTEIPPDLNLWYLGLVPGAPFE